MDLLEEIVRLQKQGRPSVLATIVHTRGSIPSFQSSKMLVRNDGTIAGTVGGGCVEADVWSAAKEVLREGKPRKLTFDLNADPRYDIGLTCGGTLEIYVEPVLPSDSLFEELLDWQRQGRKSVVATVLQQSNSPEPARRLHVRDDGATSGALGDDALEAEVRSAARDVIQKETSRKLTFGDTIEISIEPVLPQPVCYLFGAGHVAQHVARMAASAGFSIVVVDDRARYASRERFPDATEIHADDWSKVLPALQTNPSSYLVIVTRGHKEDMNVLRWAVGAEARYIGLIGSKRKVLSIYKVLREEGVAREKLARVHAPIGIEIGSLTPEEVAVSIVAELIAVRRHAGSARSKTLGAALLESALESAPLEQTS